ncbi:MAG: leucyl aminopeptidase [Candidatus Levybacteria bacterium]|nr:leucyl aminopeptidase [Candidatus Levybacteria bacterium]
MNFEFSDKNLDRISTDGLLVFVFSGEGKSKKVLPTDSFSELDRILKGKLSKEIDLEKFSGKKKEILKVTPHENILASRVFVIGLGKRGDFKADDLRKSLGNFIKTVKGKINSLTVIIPSEKEMTIGSSIAAQAIYEGILLGNYDFSKYKSKKDEDKKELEIVIFAEKSESRKKEIKKGIELAEIYSQATFMARDLVNEQSFIATPTYLAELAKSIAKKDPKHIKCRIYEMGELEKMGMDAFLGVARGSDTPPKFIFLEYMPEKNKSKEKLALVGKGITFDSGGVNVKTGDHMSDMKMDMSGAAIVLSVFSVISSVAPDYCVIGLIAATPNLISGKSIVPGDIVRAMNGKTIEILNTDAEGRVTLADSLSFAVKQKATKIIDFATLTGAVMGALGEEISGLFSNNEEFSEKIKKAASRTGEKVWTMPLEEDYKEMNKSSVADIANIPSSRYGGAITAALFLQEFIGDTIWAHLDIAGPAFTSKGSDIGPKGATGHGVRTVLNLIK